MGLLRSAAQRLVHGKRLEPVALEPPPVVEPAPSSVEIPAESGETVLLRLRADALEKRADMIEDALRRADRRAEEVERRADGLEGTSRVAAERVRFIEAMVSEVDGFRMARARQLDLQRRTTERFVTSLAGLLERLDGVQQDLTALRAEQDRMTATRAAGGMPTAELDRLYLQFENRLRGSREDIKDRQAPYLDLVREAGAGTTARPVLDIGAGRGEWLEVLREHGLVSRGVDLNKAMVELCRSLDLDCVETDALSLIEGLPDASLGMITGFHIIEHLPFEVFVRLLDQGLRVLAPGGLLLVETPDPQNLIVGSHTFYNDPTHRNPLPSLAVRTMAEARGYRQVEIRRLHPSPSRFTGIDTDLIGQLNDVFFGPQDYAMIARKAA